MSDKPLPYGRQLIEADDIEAVVAQLRGDWLTQGPTVAAFEQALCAATGARYAVAVSSGTAALHIACLAAGFGPGVHGLVPDITFVATGNAVRYCGGTPVLVDVDPSTGLIALDPLRARVAELTQQGRKIGALLPVSFSGAVPDLAAIKAIADGIGALVIEDCAHALGARYQATAPALRGGAAQTSGQTFRAASCAHTDMAILSFHPVKHITTGEGGAITTNDEALYRKLCDLRTHGITKDPSRLRKNDGPWYYEQHSLGFNYRITDLQCALGITQLAKLERFVSRRREIAARYDRAFAAPELASRFSPLRVPEGVASSYHLYVLQLRPQPGESLASLAGRRLALYQRLRDAAILPQVHYIPVHTQPDFVDAGLGGGSFPGADAYYAGCISLPMFPAMSDADMDRVVDCIRAG